MNNTEHCIRFDDIKVDLLQLRVWHGEKFIHFTLTELRLLLAFLVEPYRTFTRDELVQRADVTSPSALMVLIVRLRRLLDQQYIFTVGGMGYRFSEPTHRRNHGGNYARATA